MTPSPLELLLAGRYHELVACMRAPTARNLLLQQAAAHVGPPPGMAEVSGEESLAARQLNFRATGDWSWGLLTAKQRREFLVRDASLLIGSGKPDRGKAQLAAVKKLVAEMGQIFSEFDKALQDDDLDWLVPLAEHLRLLMEIVSKFTEMRERYGLLLDAAQRLSSPRLELLAQLGLCVAHARLGDYSAAGLAGHQARELAIKLSNRHGEALALGKLGIVEFMQGNYSPARQYLAASLAIQHELGDRHGEAGTINNLALVESEQGNYAVARELYTKALVLNRELGNRVFEAKNSANLGRLEYFQGNYPAARELYSQALAIWCEMGNRQSEANALTQLGSVESAQGNHQAALELHTQALAINREVGDRRSAAITLDKLGTIEMQLGRLGAARELLAQALAILWELGAKTLLTGFCLSDARLLVELGCWRAAALTCHGALSCAAQLSYKFEPDIKQELGTVLARLDAAVVAGEISADELARWKAEGAAMSLDELAQFTLQALTDVPDGIPPAFS